jgi:hypothetical protein
MTFLLNVIERGEVQVPLGNVIVAVELLNTCSADRMYYQGLPLMDCTKDCRNW